MKTIMTAYYSQLLCALVEAGGAFILSTILGFTSAGLLSMMKDVSFDVTEEEGSWIGAAVPALALIGSLSAGTLVETFGRKFLLLYSNIPLMCAWIWIAMATSALPVLLARCASGFVLGVQQVAVSIFVSETVHPKLRPMFSAYPATAAALGFLAVSLPPSITDWRGLAYIGAAACLPFVLLLMVLPETPYFLVKTGKREQAYRNLKWLRNTETEAQMELKELESSAMQGKNAGPNLYDMFSPPHRWPMCTAILLLVFQQGTGISALTSFMGLIFDRAGSAVDTSVCSAVLTVLNIVSISYAAPLFLKKTRIYFIKLSSYLVVGSLCILFVYLKARESSGAWKDISEYFTIIPLISYSVYVLGFTLGWGPIPWMFIGDGLPLSIRGKGAAIVVASSWLFSFLFTKSFSSGTLYFGTSSVILSYIVFTLFGMCIMIFYLPETLGFMPAQLEKYYADAYKKKSKNE